MFHDINGAIQAAIHARMANDSYYSRIAPGSYRSGAVAYCAAKAALKSPALAPVLGTRNLKTRIPDYRSMTYGEWIHKGVQDVLYTALKGQRGTWFFPEVWSNAEYSLNGRPCRITARADGLFATQLAPGKWELEVMEMKTHNPFQITKHPENLPYPWQEIQALLAFYGTRAGARSGMKLYLGDPPNQTCIGDVLKVQEKDELTICSSICFFPRDVVRSRAKEPDLEQIAQWFLLRRQYTEEENDAKAGKIMAYLEDWDRIFMGTLGGLEVGPALNEAMAKWGTPAEIMCSNCEVRAACPMYNPEEFKKLF